MMQGRRARLAASGWEGALQVEDFDVPEPGPGQVRVRVEACGVCHRDLIDRAGSFPWLQLPITPGHEVAGRVEALGDGVTGWGLGDRVGTLHRDHCGACPACVRGDTSLCPNALFVLGLVADGGYATHLVAPEDALFRLPEGPAADLAALHCTAGTAFRGLRHQADVRPGDHVLITGANGGVGAAAIQVAKRLGATVTAVVRRLDAVAFVTRQGADRVVTDDGDGFHRKVKAADVVLDCVGSPTFNSSLRSLRMGGHVVVVGNISEARAALNLGYAIVNGLHITGSSGATAADMAALLALHAETPLDLPALRDRVLPLDDAEAAQRAVRAGGLAGRVVLDPTLPSGE